MRFAYLLPLDACTHHFCTPDGLVVLQDHTKCDCGVTATVYQREQGPQRFGRKLDSEDGGEHPGEVGRHVGDPLTRGEGPRLSTKLQDWELGPCERFLARGSNKDKGEACALLDTSVKISESSTGVCISIPYSLASVFTLQSWFVLYFSCLVIG